MSKPSSLAAAIFLIVTGHLSASTPLQLVRAAVAGETLPLTPPAPAAPVVWPLHGTALAWTAGEGVRRMEESGEALQLFPGDGGAELVSPSPLGLHAAAYGTLRITFAAHPLTAPVSGTVGWVRSDGAPRSLAFAVEPHEGHIDVPIGEQLTWYGSIDRLSVRLPPTLESAPYALSSNRIGRDGFVFRNAYAQGNNTPTSVLALLNSQYASNAPWSNPHPARPSLARYLGEHGFHTVMIVSNPALQVPYEAAGFDVVVYINPNSRHLSSEMEERLRWAFQQFRGEDLFVYAHFLDPHAPYAPPPHTAGTYSSPNGSVGRTVEPWLFPERYLQPGLNYPPIIPSGRLTPEDRQATIDLYDEEVLDVSLHLERLWETLTRLGLYDRALIMLSVIQRLRQAMAAELAPR